MIWSQKVRSDEASVNHYLSSKSFQKEIRVHFPINNEQKTAFMKIKTHFQILSIFDYIPYKTGITQKNFILAHTWKLIKIIKITGLQNPLFLAAVWVLAAVWGQ